MDASDFAENDFGDGGFAERDLAELAAALGLEYEIGFKELEYEMEFEERRRSRAVDAWVKMKGPGSRRYAVFAPREGGRAFPWGSHSKRIQCRIVIADTGPAGRALTPDAVRRIRDETAALAVKSVLSGCRVKISERRRVVVPPAGSVEELRLALAVTGGHA